MAYKFQKDFAILSGAIEPAANNDPTLSLGGLTRAWSNLYLSGTAYVENLGTVVDPVDKAYADVLAVTSSLEVAAGKFRYGTALVTATAAELNYLDNDDLTAADLQKLADVTATAAELNYTDITAVGSGEASKALVLDANKDIDAIGALSASCFFSDGVTALSSSKGDVVAGSGFVLGNAGQYGFTRAGALTAGAITGTTVSGSGNFNVGADLQLGTGAQYGIQRDGQLDIANMGTNWTNVGRTVADLGSITTVDINGGTADNVVIGGSTAAAGTFTSLTANDNVTLGSSNTDIIIPNALVSGSLIPEGDSVHELGSSAKRWKTIYVDEIVGATTAFDTEYVGAGATIAAATDFAICTGAGTVTLPAAAAGKYLYIKSSVDGNVILAANSGDSFPEGAPTLRATGSAILCIAKDNASWFIL